VYHNTPLKLSWATISSPTEPDGQLTHGLLLVAHDNLDLEGKEPRRVTKQEKGIFFFNILI